MVKLCWAEIILHICDLITNKHSFLLNLKHPGLLLDADNTIFGIHICDRAVPLNSLDWAIAVGGEADQRADMSPSPTTAVVQSMKHPSNLRKSLEHVIFKKFNVQFIGRNGHGFFAQLNLELFSINQ